MGARLPTILLIENDAGDIFLFRRALSRLNYRGNVRVVGSVSEARAYLEGVGAFCDREYYPAPDMIISDMNLSGQTGNDFLEWIRKDERFVDIPFVFLSGSFRPSDKARSAELGPHGFFTKSGDVEEMVVRVQHMLNFLPRDETNGN